MSISLDVSRTTADQVVVGPCSLTETMATLHVLSAADHHPEAVRLIQQTTERLDAEELDALFSFSPLWSRFRCRLFFPLLAGATVDWEATLQALADVDDEVFVVLAAEGILGLGRASEAPVRDLVARGELVTACARRSTLRAELAQRLLSDPARFRADLAEFLQLCWDRFMAERWHEGRRRLDDEVQRVRLLLSRGLPEALAGLTDNASRTVSPGVVSFDKLATQRIEVFPRRLHVVPSLAAWPHVTVKDSAERSELPIVIVYPVRGLTHGISQRLLLDRLGALSSASRLELCRHLLGEPITTSELAARLDISESQVSRALRQLRDCGLVESWRHEKTLRHRVVVERLQALGPDIVATVTR
ncbi:ArsR/SmtB family transcription factor [Nocardioides acrostichi]|uniref:Winged helix-turn-helix transcriptional regulator n=1 Tax=Nocardioides acrostichi TaxID=2784339 RepID=A0A930YCF9_9ACTN|nr:DUF5937 family protein [Nocardioides acrostichi]MBF4163448.1 winged helix-turn-helix transcriptional regulator [Nocardioides acrostichi]